MHTFGITDNYFVIIEQPLSISVVEAVKAKVLRKPLSSMFKWFQDEYTLIHVLCRRSGSHVSTFKAATFFFLHIINAYESDDHIVVDVCCYRDPSVLDCMYVDAMENMQQIMNYANMFKSRPLRFVLPINVPCSELCDESSTLLSWNYCKWIKNMARATCVEKPYQNMKHMNGVFDDGYPTIDDEMNGHLDNLVKLKYTTAKAYRMASQNDSNERFIFCVPEMLCDIGCETPRINEKICQGKGQQTSSPIFSIKTHFLFQARNINIFMRSAPT